ncbi:uncharacterized protein K444DRAFT_627066 [Hyaloscypha bicolor E]|uniref:Core Histone H2A/H2B/H3 domain-containing protein n=1 Tax=Hyaloscypha bicolor E TaxID=1095630 RepID=A0A2J6TJZ2_9HELO|nr:uncharacterized protein K444DRAFT_627066 [Hyaloscypha bicolor E]PMD63343.1 hypothetical protein K444DRAFT_627066 [Hyaloscypha bicolor E]
MANNSAAAKALKKISKIALKKTGWQEAGGIKSKEQEQKGKEVKALQEIRRYQKSVKLLIPRLPFICLAREIIQEQAGQTLRIERGALGALQEVARSMVMGFESS